MAAASRPFRVGVVGPALFLFFVAEVALLTWVANRLGWWTAAIVVGTAILGLALLRLEWRRAWGAIIEATRSGQLPTGRIADASLILLGGALLLLPGLISDALGLALLLPFSRSLVRRAIGSWAARRHSTGSGGVVIVGEVVREDRPDEGTTLVPEIGAGSEPPGEGRGPLTIPGELDQSDPDGPGRGQ